MKRSDPTHQRLEWARFVGENSGGNLFWQTAQAANAFFGPTGHDDRLDPEVADSVRRTEEWVTANAATVGAVFMPPPGWGLSGPSFAMLVPSSSLSADAGGQPIPAPPPQKPPVPPVTTPGDDDDKKKPGMGSGESTPLKITGEKTRKKPCCCIPLRVTAWIEWTSALHFLESDYNLTIHVKYEWAAKESLEDQPCKAEWWEWLGPKNKSKNNRDRNEELIYPNPDWNEVGQHPIGVGHATSMQEEFDAKVEKAMALCHGGSFELDPPDTMTHNEDEWETWQYFRLLPGCVGSPPATVSTHFRKTKTFFGTEPPIGKVIPGYDAHPYYAPP